MTRMLYRALIKLAKFIFSQIKKIKIDREDMDYSSIDYTTGMPKTNCTNQVNPFAGMGGMPMSSDIPFPDPSRFDDTSRWMGS